MSTKTAIALRVAHWYLLPFFLVTLIAYRCWYVRLQDRGMGLLYNAVSHQAEFEIARLAFGIIGIGGIVILEAFRKDLPSWMRLSYIMMVASMVAFFVVDWIIVRFGPQPFWHHP